MSDFDNFQAWTNTTWKSIGSPGSDMTHAAMGLAEEAGEVLGKVKKAHRGDYGPCGPEGVLALHGDPAIKKEIGDVIYYVAQCCEQFGFEFSDVVETLKVKLLDRKARGVLKGSGDDR